MTVRHREGLSLSSVPETSASPPLDHTAVLINLGWVHGRKKSGRLLRSGGLLTHPLVSDDESGLNDDLVAEVEVMLRDGTAEGLSRLLRSKFPTFAEEADAAIGQGVAQLITRPHAPQHPRAYLAAIATNEMNRVARHWARRVSLDQLANGDDEQPGWEPSDPSWTVEEQALLGATYDALCAYVATWDTETVRVVTSLYLEAAFKGEPLPSEAAAELASGLLGYKVDDAFVRTWKSRGFRKLRAYITSVNSVDARREETLT